MAEVLCVSRGYPMSMHHRLRRNQAVVDSGMLSIQLECGHDIPVFRCRCGVEIERSLSFVFCDQPLEPAFENAALALTGCEIDPEADFRDYDGR